MHRPEPPQITPPLPQNPAQSPVSAESWLSIPPPEVDRASIEVAARMILEAIGENPGREGLLETPRRVAKMWAEFVGFNPGTVDTTFAQESSADQLVTVSGMKVWSMCEHHLLPFWCEVSVGYLATGRILGLSKFARIAKWAGRRLQNQERLVEMIAGAVAHVTGSPDVAVTARGMHLCMLMRGAETEGTMSSSSMLGRFRSEPAVREEFFQLTRRS